MALIDVSELLVDPDFVNSIQIIRRTTAVGTNGKNTVTEGATVNTVGSIQPANQKDLLRLPESMRTRDVRAFWIKAELQSDGSGTYPDLLVFGGRRFEIFAIEPWNNYGQGWNKGICVAQEFT